MGRKDTRKFIAKHKKWFIIGFAILLFIFFLSHWLGPKMDEPIISLPAVEESSE